MGLPIGQAVGSGLRNLPKLLGRILSKPGRMGEDFAAGIAGRGTRSGVGVARGSTQNLGWSQTPLMGKGPAVRGKGGRWSAGPQVQIGTQIDPINASGLNYSNVNRYAGENAADTLNGLGYAGQALGYGTVAGGATLGGMMMMGKDKGEAQSSHDSNGILSKGYDEELGKLRQKINQDYLAGDKAFSMAKYQNMRKNAKWIDTAIAEIGIDKYKQLRRQLMTGEGGMDAQKFHSIMTDAVVHDDEAAAQAATEPYVLPGISRNAGGQGRFIVIAPMKGKKGGETKYHALKYGINDLEDNQQQQGQSQQ